MKLPHCISSWISMQMVMIFFCQMIAHSHLLPLNQQELDFMLDPVAQAQQDGDGLESKRVVAKSVFDVPMKATAPTIIRCPPDSQRIVEGGPCVPTASSITIQYNLFKQLSKESVQFNNNRRKTGPGHKTKHRIRTTTVSPKVNSFGTGTSPSTGSRPAPLVHSQDSAEKQTAQNFPSTAYVLQNPQENMPLPINQQMTSVNSHHQSLQPINNDETKSITTTEQSTVSDDARDQTSTTISSSEIPGVTMLASTLSDITDSLAITLSTTTFRSADQVTDRTNDMDMETSSSTHVPRPLNMSSIDESGSIGKDTTILPAESVRNVNSDTNSTGRPDRQDFHFGPTTTNTDQLIQTTLPFRSQEQQNANNTTEKVWFAGEIKSTIEPPIAAEEFNSFSPGMQFSSGQSQSNLEFTTNKEASILSLLTSTQPTSFATIESLMHTTDTEETLPTRSIAHNENNFATTTVKGSIISSESETSTPEKNRSPLEGSERRPVATANRNEANEESTTSVTWMRERLLKPEVEVDFDVDGMPEDILTDKLPEGNFPPQRRHSLSNPSSFLTVRPSHMKSAFTILSHSQNENGNPISLRPQSIRHRDPILNGSPDFPQPTRSRQRHHNQNQFYVYDYLTFNPDRPPLSR